MSLFILYSICATYLTLSAGLKLGAQLMLELTENATGK